MHDPDEGVGPDGTILTGARRERVPVAFEPVIAAAVDGIRAISSDVALYLYGSVATGRARIGESDVDLLTIGLPTEAAEATGSDLSHRFSSLCRGVEISTAQPSDFSGESDEAYGNKVFLHHYCVQIHGGTHTDLSAKFPADSRAARGFNGDIDVAAHQWRNALDRGADPSTIAYRLARKTLLAVSSLVSVHDETWTTDRARAAVRWGEIDPPTASGMAELLEWAGPRTPLIPTRQCVQYMLDETVTGVVEAFRTMIGLWSDR